MSHKYVPSNAREEFKNSLVEITETLKLIAPPKKVDPKLKNYVLGAAILFMSAKLENYISDLFKGICQRACGEIQSADGIPAHLLGWIFLNDGHLELSRSFVARSDEGDFIKKTGTYLQQDLLAKQGTFLKDEKFRGIDSKSYPSVKNVKKMYRRIGIESIFTLLSKRMKVDVEGRLKSFNSIRGKLAHSGIDGAFSYGDIKAQRKSINQLVAALDKETFYFLRQSNAWKAWPAT